MNSARSARQHKAWGGASAASGTPGSRYERFTEPAKRATATTISNCQFPIAHCSPIAANRRSTTTGSPASRALIILGSRSWGLRPRAGVPSRAARLGWKSLCCRLLRRLVTSRRFVVFIDNPERAMSFGYELISQIERLLTARFLTAYSMTREILARLHRLGARVADACGINHFREVVPRLLLVPRLRRRLPRSVPPAIAVRLALL